MKQDFLCDAIVVNYNAGHGLHDCITSVLTHNRSRAIIVDNASSDDSLSCIDKIASCKDSCVVIENNKNYGFSAACNMGVMASTAQYLLFLNPDCIIEQGALQRMMAVLNSDQSIGMVGGYLCNLDGTEQPGGRRVFPTPRRAFMRAFGLSRFGKRYPRIFSDFLLHQDLLPEKPIAVEAISGACMLVKRSAVDVVGLWDDGYFLHCEDLDWCMRFHQSGYKIMFVPDAKITHSLGVCSRTRPIFVEWHKHKGMIRFYRKFFRHQYPGILMWVVVIGVWLRFTALAVYEVLQKIMRIMRISRA